MNTIKNVYMSCLFIKSIFNGQSKNDEKK